MEVLFNCPCSCPEGPVQHPMMSQLDLSGAQSLLNDPQTIARMTCGSCGCAMEPVDNTTDIGFSDVSAPRVDGVNPTSDQIVGGAAVTLSGHRLDLGSLVIKFNGTPGTSLRNRTDASATVDAPAGHIRLDEIGERQRKLDYSTASGTLQVGDELLGLSRGGKLLVKVVDPSYVLVETVRGQIDAGEQFTATPSGVTATAGTYHPEFQVGETVRGETSNATAVLRILQGEPDQLLKVDTFNGQFVADEWVEGLTSGARVQLSSSPQDGSVVITVENENGSRSVGGALYGVFSYTL